jgi:cbb3-type cytochrome oxidase maturation protein
MTIIWIMFICSVVLLPATALLALRWSAKHGAFEDFKKTALSIFDEEEPVGKMSDHFPGGGTGKNRSQP